MRSCGSPGEDYKKYRKPLSIFINNFADTHRTLSSQEKASYQSSFKSALDTVKDLLGELSFKIFGSDLKVESSFNSALYDALMVGISVLIDAKKLKSINIDNARSKLSELMETDEAFRKSISIATSDEVQVRYRIEAITRLYGD